MAKKENIIKNLNVHFTERYGKKRSEKELNLKLKPKRF